MSQLFYSYARVGIVMHDNNDGVPEEWLAFGNTTEGGGVPWWEGMLAHIYGTDAPPECLEIDCHYLRGAQKGGYAFKIPLLLIKPEACGSITDSGSSPADLTEFLAEYEKGRPRWEAIIADFVERCQKLGIKLNETKPHVLVYIHWDDFPTT